MQRRAIGQHHDCDRHFAPARIGYADDVNVLVLVRNTTWVSNCDVLVNVLASPL